MTGIPVVLVHGVGFGPETLSPLAAACDGAMVLERRGYGSRAAEPVATDIGTHVADLVALLDDAGHAQAVVAGASGGATVALAAALLAPERVLAAVCHEPAVGTLAPELRAVVRAALAAGGGVGLLEALAGPETWARVDHTELVARADIFAADAEAFLCFEPPLDRVPEAAPVICSVGERSEPLRHEIARRLALLCDGRVVQVGGCGHLPQFDAPEAFAALIHSTMEERCTLPS